VKRNPTTLATVTMFGAAVAFTSVAATFGVVLLSLPPVGPRYSAKEAVAALRGETATNFERTIRHHPLEGVRARMIEEMLAEALERPQADVRAIYRGRFRTTTRVTSAASALPPGTKTRSYIRSDPVGGSEFAVPSSATGSLREFFGVKMAPFAASVRLRDGSWATVEPNVPTLAGYRGMILAALALAVLLLLPLAWFMARRLVRPLGALIRALDDNDDLPMDGPLEVLRTAAAIQTMRTRLVEEATERTRMLSAVAHDLRTPLMGLRLRLEAMPEPQRSKMVADVERMRSMIADVLMFARRRHRQGNLVDIGALLSEIVLTYHGEGAVRLTSGPDATVRVDEDALRRAVGNLIENALKYAGDAHVLVERRSGYVSIRVEDTGPGIELSDRARLMRPFERGEASRNNTTGGVGLGLSIVASFASQHGGSFFLKGAPGGGLAAEITLPLDEPAMHTGGRT
jgi:signal transduction histidine kinase